MREKFISDFKIANRTKSPARREQRYSAILLHPNVREHLTKMERANIFYNRSIANSEIADTHFQNMDYKKAAAYMRRAGSDAHSAEILYVKPEDIKACKERITEYHNNRQKCIALIPQELIVHSPEQPKSNRLEPSSGVDQTAQSTIHQAQEDLMQYSGAKRSRDVDSNIEQTYVKNGRTSIFANLNLSNLEKLKNLTEVDFTLP